MATIQERLKLLDEFHDKERGIMEAKAHDYSGGKDCNKNIKFCEVTGLASAETGVLVRACDKLQRLITLIGHKEPAKVAESLEDTIQDLRNYLIILAHLLRERKGSGKEGDEGDA